MADVPAPQVDSGRVMIQTSFSMISTGTERMLLEFGKASFLEKIRLQPDKVKQVINKLKTDGFQPTLDAVLSKMEQPLPLGYCNVGRVVAVASDVSALKIGDRVVSNGKHAELVGVPVNLCCKIPDEVPDEEAVYSVLGAISLQGIRLIKPTLGESIVVIGLGLIGLIAVQLLKAHGCRVLGLDYDSGRLELAKRSGADTFDLSSGNDPSWIAREFSRGRGVDGVLITTATTSDEPIKFATAMSRKRGRIVLTGTAGLNFSREAFYEKELTFQVSSSYGPGRHDHNYEERGIDYPIGYVRWTEQRNFEAFLDMLANGSLEVSDLTSHVFGIEQISAAYELVTGKNRSLGILLKYPGGINIERARSVLLKTSAKERPNQSNLTLDLIGSGNYANSKLLPAFSKAGVRFGKIISREGMSSYFLGAKFNFKEASTDLARAFDGGSEILVIATRHNTHAELVSEGLKKGKNVFVEKPLCLTLAELDRIEREARSASGNLMVGFNRRFAPHIKKIKLLMSNIATPKSIIITVNAGSIDIDHWTQDPEVGGGRILGEACHFIDLLRYLVGVEIIEWCRSDMAIKTNDTATISLRFRDGSLGTIHYFSNGSNSFQKERIEIFTEGKILKLDNFRKLKGYGWPGFSKMNLWRQDKGQLNCVDAFVQSVKLNKIAPIALEEVLEVSRVSIDLAKPCSA